MAWIEWRYDGRRVRNGRAWKDDDGALHFYGRKDGVEVSLGEEERAAFEKLRTFREDPQGYRAHAEAERRAAEAEAPLFMDEKLVEDFLLWSQKVQGNTVAWVRRQRGSDKRGKKTGLVFWGDRFAGRDLRHLDLKEDILPALDRKNRTHLIQILKRFLSWLRKEKHLLTAAQDPSYGTLSAPQSKPAQWKKSKAIPKEHVELALEHLVAPWRDVLTLQAGTGWHISEASRFAASGSVEPLPRSVRADGECVAVAVCPRTKGGETLRTRVTEQVAEAARRLLAHGPFPERTYYDAIASACTAAGIPIFRPGMMRHSVATWAVNAGADPSVVAAYLGHKSPATTRRFYATLAAPAKIPTLI